MFLYGLVSDQPNDQPTEKGSSFLAARQGWPTPLTGKPHNSLRTRLRAALVYEFTQEGGGEKGN